MPYPHSTIRFDGVRGRILDAQTHEPVAGALIEVAAHRSTFTRTDSTGAFHLASEFNYHVIGIFIPAHNPLLENDPRWSPTLFITRAGYKPVGFDAAKPSHIAPSYTGRGEILLTDILLEPE